MRIFLIAIMIAAFTLPAYSQTGSGGASGRSMHSEPPVEDKEKKKQEEKAFNEATKRIPVPEKKYDPWGNVRSTGK